MVASTHGAAVEYCRIQGLGRGWVNAAAAESTMQAMVSHQRDI
jgi:hypothetical protein